MTDVSRSPPVYAFGTFRLIARTGVLQDSGRDVRLGSRGVALLTALVEAGGEVVPGDELIAQVWPTTTVDEQNLRVQVAGLRKALADGHGDERFIATVAGRGYRFVAPVSAEPVEEPRHNLPPALGGNLPAALTRLFGRAEAIDDLRRRLADERLVTIVGPGGVGKTCVALAVAHAVAAGGAWFADLAPVSDPALVPTALLETFGLAASPENMPAALAHRLAGRDALLVLDNCEHLVQACASLVEALLRAVRGLRILATSREPLRAAGEWVVRLPALETPEAGVALATASACSAVQLFAHRAASSDDRFVLTDVTSTPVVDICRRLEGMPLALELAAAAVRALGVNGVAQRLREQLELPGLGRRTAAVRQATLRATLDWSYRLLSPAEQQALRRLAVFQGAFTQEGAAAVGGHPGAGEAPMLELLARLSEKSLLSVDLTREDARYRLLQTTRAFALERLTPRELGATRARHAREMMRLAERTDEAWGAGDSDQARRDAAELIDDLSAAIDWALSPIGNIDTAVDLLVSATPLRRRLSLMREHRRQVNRALEQVRALSPPNPGAEMRLLGSYGPYGRPDWLVGASERMQVLAQELGDTEHLMLGLWDRASAAVQLRDIVTYRQCAGRLAAAAGSRSSDAYRALGHCLFSSISLYDGDIDAARREAVAGLNLLADASIDLHIARLGFDPPSYLYKVLGAVLWTQGFADQTRATARACVAHCRQLSHAQSLMYALSDVAAQAALLTGDIDGATTLLDEHWAYCQERGESGYPARAQEFMRAVLHVERTGRADTAGAALVAPGNTHPLIGNTFLALRIAEAVGLSKSAEDGLAAIETVAAHAAAGGADGYAMPEILRARASVLRKGGADAGEVEPILRQALERARRMQAVALELRVASALAELLSDIGRRAEGLAMLGAAMERVTEGRDDADFRRASSLRETLSRT